MEPFPKKTTNKYDFCKAVHEAEYSNASRYIQPNKKFRVVFGPSEYSDEKFRLFESYQMAVHNEPLGKPKPKSFKGFLCDSPLNSKIGPGMVKLGSYHESYILDSKLIGMGVLDLLPDCVSSVYLTYEPSLKDLVMGKVGIARELARAIENGYRWYYMGKYT